MHKVIPYLWYKSEALEAMNFYVDVFNGSPVKKTTSKIISVDHYPDEVPFEGPMAGLKGKVSHGVFELAGQRIIAFDGGPMFTFTAAFSLYVDCESQEEVDYFWHKLSADPEAEACGWLKDKFGLSWQIIPTALGEMVGNPDPQKSGRAMQAMLKMKKIDIAALQKAFDGQTD